VRLTFHSQFSPIIIFLFSRKNENKNATNEKFFPRLACECATNFVRGQTSVGSAPTSADVRMYIGEQKKSEFY
jgi:hypothetical protein